MMNQPGTTRGPSWLRLVLLPGLLIGLLVVTGGLAPRAHAQTTLTVTNCSSDSQLQADVNTANSDNADDTITFACSGDIKLSGTLIIGRSMTLDGSGQSVTLDGQNHSEVLAVKSGASFTLNALTIADGFSDFGSGGLSNFGGTVTITNSTFGGNTATTPGNGGAGGGLYNQGTVSISNSTFIENTAGVPGNGTGGGLYNDQGTVSISNSTFVLNRAGAAGGGLVNAAGTVSISNSTFTINISPGGGGLFNCCVGGTANISNSTFANNEASQGGGLYNAEDTVSIGGSIVANNTGGDCSNVYGGSTGDQGYNLDSDGSCGFTASTDLQNTDPKLDPQRLQNNGGPTQTIALQSGSPAIDRIPAASCPATDQRGFTRPDDASEGACDMGAYESNYDDDLGLTNVPATITINATSPQGATVTYTPPTVVDEEGPLPTVNCTPASGSVLPIGTTTVTCTVADSDDANSPVSHSFQVVVEGAAAQASDLINLVNSFGLPAGPQASFDTQLQAVQTDLTNNNTTQACSDLTAFINHVKAQSGKQLSVSQANQLIAAAKQVQALLGC